MVLDENAVYNGDLTTLATVTDEDTTDAYTWQLAGTPDIQINGGASATFGVLTLNAADLAIAVDPDGTFTITEDAFNHLGTGDTVTVTFDVVVNDGNLSNNLSEVKTVSVEIIGTNDTPVIDSVTDGSVEENFAVAGATIATVAASDADANDTPTYSL